MKRVRALLAALVTACGLLLGAAEILAANQGKLESVQGNTTVREGQEVALRFSLEEIPGISGEINALKGTLEQILPFSRQFFRRILKPKTPGRNYFSIRKRRVCTDQQSGKLRGRGSLPAWTDGKEFGSGGRGSCRAHGTCRF